MPIILRPCKMMGASFAFRKTSLLHRTTAIHGGTEGGSGKTNGVRKKEVVAVEGTENATGNNSEVRRFFEAQGETSPSLYI